jgi:hypothetical protein
VSPLAAACRAGLGLGLGLGSLLASRTRTGLGLPVSLAGRTLTPARTPARTRRQCALAVNCSDVMSFLDKHSNRARCSIGNLELQGLHVLAHE